MAMATKSFTEKPYWLAYRILLSFHKAIQLRKGWKPRLGEADQSVISTVSNLAPRKIPKLQAKPSVPSSAILYVVDGKTMMTCGS